MRPILLILPLLAACGQFPDLSDTLVPEAQLADFPSPTSLGAILLETEASAARRTEIEEETSAQIARSGSTR